MKSLLFTKGALPFLAAVSIMDVVVLPQPIALIVFAFFFLLDLVTGLALAHKAHLLESNIARSKTFAKLLQYTVVIAVGIGASSTSKFLPESLQQWSMPLKVIGDVLVWYCVAIEALSNIENGIKMAPDSDVSNYILKPLAKVLKLKVDEFEKYLDKVNEVSSLPKFQLPLPPDEPQKS